MIIVTYDISNVDMFGRTPVESAASKGNLALCYGVLATEDNYITFVMTSSRTIVTFDNLWLRMLTMVNVISVYVRFHI